MEQIKLTLTVEEANVILEALGNMPYKTVYQLVGKIQQQAAQQISKNRPHSENGTTQKAKEKAVK